MSSKNVEVVRVSKEMRELLDETVNLFRSKDIDITRVQASRILAKKAQKKPKIKIDVEAFNIRL
jgi:hypothetical protein